MFDLFTITNNESFAFEPQNSIEKENQSEISFTSQLYSNSKIESTQRPSTLTPQRSSTVVVIESTCTMSDHLKVQ